MLVDRYSRWLEIKLLGSTSATSVISRMKDIFSTHGFPDVVESDNGPCYVSREFQDFAKRNEFELVTSSPHFPQANGEAESAVKIAKKILSQEDPHLALIIYRNTPHSATGISPAVALMSRRLKTRLPVLLVLRRPENPDRDALRQSDLAAKLAAKQYYDRHHGARPLTPLDVGQPVRVKLDSDKTWAKSGVIVRAEPDLRTYLVNTPAGPVRRNRHQLRPSVVQQVPPRPVPELNQEFRQVPPPVREPRVPAPPSSPSRGPPSPVPLTPPPSARAARERRAPTRLIESM